MCCFIGARGPHCSISTYIHMHISVGEGEAMGIPAKLTRSYRRCMWFAYSEGGIERENEQAWTVHDQIYRQFQVPECPYPVKEYISRSI